MAAVVSVAMKCLDDGFSPMSETIDHAIVRSGAEVAAKNQSRTDSFFGDSSVAKTAWPMIPAAFAPNVVLALFLVLTRSAFCYLDLVKLQKHCLSP